MMSQLSIQKGFALFLPFLVIALVSLSLSAQTITVSPASGSPGIGTTVHGSGFPPNTAVRVSFDGTMALAPVLSDGSGAFQKSIRVPASAQPGNHRVGAGVSGLGALAATKFLVRTDWPQFGFDPAGGRWNRYENTLSVSTVPALGLWWQSSVGGSSSLAVANGVVYAGSADGNVYALSATTGRTLWSFKTAGGAVSSPAVANGVVYAGSSIDAWHTGTLYALKASTGKLLWKFTPNNRVGRWGAPLWSTPVVANGVVYVGFNGYGTVGEMFYALSAKTGAVVWSTPGDWHYIQPAAIANGVVYVQEMSYIQALNASTGAVQWDLFVYYYPGSAPALANGMFYTAFDGRVIVLDANTGAELWRFDMNNAGTGYDGLLAVADGVVYAVSNYDPHLYALNANTGALLWSETAGAPVTPVVANGVLYACSPDGYVSAFNASTGDKLWSSTSTGTGMAVADGVVYVGSDDGNVYAYRLPPASLDADGENDRAEVVSDDSGTEDK
jgi:outer membrane protein assembly factor BamB